MLVELEGSTDVSRKEREHFVEELIVRMILQHKAHKIREVLHKLIRWIHPNEMMISRGFRMEALLTGGSKRDRDVAVLWTLGCQETEKLHTSSILFATVFNNEMNCILKLSGNREMGAMAVHVMEAISSKMVVCMVS